MERTLMEKEIGTNINVCGYKILIKSPTISEKSKGGIFLSDSYKSMEQKGHNVGKVIKMGRNCYNDHDRFLGERYCEEGDWVLYAAYERDRIEVNGHICFILHDDRIIGALEDPRVIVKDIVLSEEELKKIEGVKKSRNSSAVNNE